MQPLPQLKPSSSTAPAAASNPFARALAETEQSLGSGDNQNHLEKNSLFSDALAKTGGKFDFDSLNKQAPGMDWEKQQQQLIEKQKKEAQRKKLHDQINPIDLVDVYNAREKKVKEEIDKLREELKLLANDVKKFDKEVQITLMTEVVDPGQDGKYYIAFFQKLRAFIMLLRQKIKSASTWATQMHSKNGKRKKKSGPGLNIGGAGHEKTSTVQDMMHHERSNSYAGG